MAKRRTRSDGCPIGRRESSPEEDAAWADRPVDFSDPESQRVLRAAARAVAYELGRQAGGEYFAEVLRQSRRAVESRPTLSETAMPSPNGLPVG
jgi:hypothetical protein